MGSDASGEGFVYEVVVRHNLVRTMRRVARTADMRVAATRLEVSSELAANHQANGCIDGSYRFRDAEQARSFALLSLGFVARLLERRQQSIERMDTGAGFTADDP